MEQTAELTLYKKTILDILYKYMEFILSFDNSCNRGYMEIIPDLENIYSSLEKKLDNIELSLSPLDDIDKMTKIIEDKLEENGLGDIKNIINGLDKMDIVNLSLALYLKNYKNSISSTLDKICGYLDGIATPTSKFLNLLLNKLKNEELSTSITSSEANNNLMDYYAASLRIHYDEASSDKMYTFMMLSLISKINEILNRMIQEMNYPNFHYNNIEGHLDCFNNHKDEINGIYPIEILITALTNLRYNIDTVLIELRAKDDPISLQLDVKSEN